MPSFVLRSEPTAVLPIATMTFGSIAASCSCKYGMHVSISTGVGVRLPGGRHFTMLQT
jgi:hypothetical protein